MAYNEPGKSKLVGYAPDNQAAYNEQAGVTIKPDAYYDMMLLKMLRQMEFHYSKYAIQKSLPRNFGDTINWRRFKKLEVAADLGLLTEGVTPAGKEGISGESIQAVISQYGEVMYFTDLVDLQQLDDVRREYTIELGYIAQETLDTIVRNTLVNEGSVYYAGGVTSLSGLTGSAHRPKIDDFRKIILGFKKDFVSGVRGASGRYVALISPEVMYALFDDQRMLQYMSFGQTNAPLQDGVAIDMFGIRFEEVLNAPVIGSAHDSIVLADEAYAITKLQGEGNVRVITKGLGSAGVSDPLDQRQSIGYKITGFSAKVLRPESVVNYWSNPTVAGTQIDANVITPAGAGEIVGGWRVLFNIAGGTDVLLFVDPQKTIAEAATLAGLTLGTASGQYGKLTIAGTDYLHSATSFPRLFDLPAAAIVSGNVAGAPAEGEFTLITIVPGDYTA
jgi:N4-gp56 family major capsid protein